MNTVLMHCDQQHPILLICAIILLTIAATFIWKKLFQYLGRLAVTRHKGMKIGHYVLNLPIRILLWALGAWFVILAVERKWFFAFECGHYGLMAKVLGIMVTLVVGWIAYRTNLSIRLKLVTKHTRTDGGYNNFSYIMSAFVFANIIITIVILAVILYLLNVPLTAIYALGGVTAVFGAALAYANQTLIANFFAGISLYFDRPFSVGDWIYTMDQSIQGTVEKIGFRYTRLRTFDQRPLYAPNNTFNRQAFVNASRMQNRRILQYIGLRYQDADKVKTILAKSREVLQKSADIDQKQTMLVCLVSGGTQIGQSVIGCFGGSSINIQIYAFTKTVNWAKFQAVQDDIMLQILKVITDEGAAVAYQTTTLDIPESISVKQG